MKHGEDAGRSKAASQHVSRFKRFELFAFFLVEKVQKRDHRETQVKERISNIFRIS
jgi:hypothetical protein